MNACRGFESLPRYHRYYESGPGLFWGLREGEDGGEVTVEFQPDLATARERCHHDLADEPAQGSHRAWPGPGDDKRGGALARI